MSITALKNIKIKAINKAEKLSRPFTTLRILNDIIEKASTSETELRNNINKGQWLASYVPFMKNKTGIIVGNFLSVNYGIRNETSILVGLVDSNFNVKGGKLFHQTLLIEEIIF